MFDAKLEHTGRTFHANIAAVSLPNVPDQIRVSVTLAEEKGSGITAIRYLPRDKIADVQPPPDTKDLPEYFHNLLAPFPLTKGENLAFTPSPSVPMLNKDNCHNFADLLKKSFPHHFELGNLMFTFSDDKVCIDFHAGLGKHRIIRTATSAVYKEPARITLKNFLTQHGITDELPTTSDTSGNTVSIQLNTQQLQYVYLSMQLHAVLDKLQVEASRIAKADWLIPKCIWDMGRTGKSANLRAIVQQTRADKNNIINAYLERHPTTTSFDSFKDFIRNYRDWRVAPNTLEASREAKVSAVSPLLQAQGAFRGRIPNINDIIQDKRICCGATTSSQNLNTFSIGSP